MIGFWQTPLVVFVLTVDRVFAGLRVYNGYEASQKSAKFVCEIPHLCTCVLISDRLVLTATHCFSYSTVPVSTEVVINQFNVSDPTPINGTAYNAPVLADHIDSISIIVLDEPVEICESDETAIPLPLPVRFAQNCSGKYEWETKFSDDQLSNGSLCRNYGYGATSLNGHSGMSSILLYCDYEFLHTNNKNNQIYERACDGEVRQGDSGSPTLCQIDGQYHLLGTLTGGPDLVARETDSYNDIRAYGDFIVETLVEHNLLEGYLKSEKKCKRYVENYAFEKSYCKP